MRGGIAIRPAQAEDRAPVLALLNQPRFFRPDELLVAEEVFSDAISKGPSSGYFSRVLQDGDKIRGWVCFGPTPCTIGTFDIYWIVVEAGHQGKGLGKRLIAGAEKEMRGMGARLSVIETASREDYLPTRRFYESAGYAESSRIPDFYTDGDDRVIYTKRVAPAKEA